MFVFAIICKWSNASTQKQKSYFPPQKYFEFNNELKLLSLTNRNNNDYDMIYLFWLIMVL